MTTDQVLTQAAAEFEKTLIHLKEEFSHLQVGRANPSLVESVSVEMYGVAQPLKALASISVPEPRTLVIQPWDRSALGPIEKAIVGTGMGLNPVNDGIVVRISIPSLTEERRRDLCKIVNKLAEDARITVRTLRQEAHNTLKQLKADSEITEDDWRGADAKLQEKVNGINNKIDESAKAKEQDVMTV